MRKRWRIAPVALIVIVLAVFAATQMASASSKKASGPAAVSGSISFDGIWTGAEANSFAQVIKAFNKVYPKVKVNYKPVGNNVPTVLATAIAGGHPPDMADIAQPGLVKQLAAQGHLKPITYASGVIAANFAPAWRALGTFNGKLYALVFKAANKSLLWYNVPSFKSAGVKAPATWSQLQSVAKTLQASGTPAYSIGGADGWTLTDLFENIYLRTFGPAKYDALSAHKIKWTDPTVITALKTMQQVIGNSSNLAGGTSGALQYGFNDSVTNAFSSPPKAAMVIEGDFVAGVITSSTKAKPGSGFNAVPFPSIKPANAGAVEIGGDLFVTFRDNPAIEAFVKFLATPAAANAWARIGGFGTGNKHVSPSIYPDAITRATEAPIGKAKQVVFDMSDEQPASFGATTGQGEWGIFQQFLKTPSNVTGIAKSLETAATAAYKKGMLWLTCGGVAVAPPVAGAPPPTGEPGKLGRYLTGAIFLAPALIILLVWMVYPAIYTIVRSFFGQSGFLGTWVGFDNYKRLWQTPELRTAIKNNAIWVAVVPAFVTAIGLMFAVLTERVRWSVAFKTIVFLPMAISAFATGVTWRIMYQQDPSVGAVNALGRVAVDAVSTPGALPTALPSLGTPMTGSTSSGLTLQAPLQPGGVAKMGLTGIPPGGVPSGAKQAVLPTSKPGAIVGVVWKDFKPGGGTPGKVEQGELGLPGVNVQLKNSAGKGVQSATSGADGTFEFKNVSPGTYRTAISASTFNKPWGGFSWLGPNLITWSLIISYIWIWAGFSMVVIGAGLAAMPRDVLEAARTDGATEWQTFRRVTVPLLAPVLSVVFITMIINVLKVFDIVLALAPESTQANANVIALAMWRTAFGGVNDFGTGSAIAVFLFLLVIPVLALNIRRFRREG